MPQTTNTLFYGDNLDVLRRHIPDEIVDLVYLDPPFNSNQNYNVLFCEKDGHRAASQIHAFEDTWTWNREGEAVYADLQVAGGRVADCIKAFRTFLGECDMLAYLVMMAPRLVELRRVMKPTASIYLHCDPAASHYLKMLMDAVFGPEHFRNEISWRRSNPKSLVTVNFPNCRDVILRYSKTGDVTFNMIYEEHDPDYVEKAYKYTDAKGRYRLLPLLNPNDNRPNLTYEFLGVTRVWRWTRERMQQAYRDGVVVQLKPGAVPQYKKYLADSKGRTVTDDWGDVQQAAGSEALGYPTQKPVALLERIITASSNAGDLVLDPFCGCGTTIAAAQKLGRPWIGIDVTHLAINLIKNRLKDAFGVEPVVHTAASEKAEKAKAAEDLTEYGEATKRPFKVIGEPVSLPDAERLAESDPYQFQWWSLGLVGARPAEGKKGADKGIDGRIVFQGDETGKFEQVVLSVKAGKLTAEHVRDLRGVVDREKAAIGVLISMQAPSKPMKVEAASAGFFESRTWNKQYPRLQLLTVAELLAGKRIEMPPIRQVSTTFKRARKIERQTAEHRELKLEG